MEIKRFKDTKEMDVNINNENCCEFFNSYDEMVHFIKNQTEPFENTIEEELFYNELDKDCDYYYFDYFGEYIGIIIEDESK